MTDELRWCGYCKSWHSKPCGDGCVWLPTDPTLEDLRAEDAKRAASHEGKDIK